MQINSEELNHLEEIAYQIRRLTVEMITYGRWGHIGGSFSMAEILAVLVLPGHAGRPRSDPVGGEGPAGISPRRTARRLCMRPWRCAVISAGRDLQLLRAGGRLEGHTDMTRTPGLESSGGPLGMGLSVAVGMALGLRLEGSAAAACFCILGDGESNEGNVWEAAMAAAHYHLDNLIAIVDYNKVMAKGFIWDLMSIEPFADKWRALAGK